MRVSRAFRRMLSLSTFPRTAPMARKVSAVAAALRRKVWSAPSVDENIRGTMGTQPMVTKDAKVTVAARMGDAGSS